MCFDHDRLTTREPHHKDKGGNITFIAASFYCVGVNCFYLYADTKIPYAIKRYKDETERLFGVLDTRLKDRNYLAGEYSIADIAHYPWINKYPELNIFMDAYPNLKGWFERVGARSAVQRGMQIPSDADYEAKENKKAEQLTCAL